VSAIQTRCLFCNKLFKNRPVVEQHIRDLHPNCSGRRFKNVIKDLHWYYIDDPAPLLSPKDLIGARRLRLREYRLRYVHSWCVFYRGCMKHVYCAINVKYNSRTGYVSVASYFGSRVGFVKKR